MQCSFHSTSFLILLLVMNGMCLFEGATIEDRGSARSYRKLLQQEVQAHHDCVRKFGIASAPYIAKIQQGNSNWHQCVGVQLTSKAVLTTASCVQPFRNEASENFDNYTGELIQMLNVFLSPNCRHQIGPNGIELNRIELSRYYIHPKYQFDVDSHFQNNIAIVEMAQQDFTNRPYQDGLYVSYSSQKDPSFPSWQEILSSILTSVDYAQRQRAKGMELITEPNFTQTFYQEKKYLRILDEEECDEILEEYNLTQYDLRGAVCGTMISGNLCQGDGGIPVMYTESGGRDSVVALFAAPDSDKQCRNYQGGPMIFTNITYFEYWISQVLEKIHTNDSDWALTPELELNAQDFPYVLDESPNNSQSVVLVIIAIVGGVLLFITIIALVAWRRHSYSKKFNFNQSTQQQNGTLSNSSKKLFKLNDDIQAIYQILKNIALTYKNRETGIPRRHSDLGSLLGLTLSPDKIQTQIQGYTMFSIDDSFLGCERGAVPSSPLLLAAMQTQRDISHNRNAKYQIQLTLFNVQNEWMQNRIQKYPNYRNRQKSLFNENVNGGLILKDTPTRQEFDMNIDYDKDLQIGDRLGHGAFGSVYKAVWLTRNMEVAVKIIHTHILEGLINDQKRGGNSFNSITGELALLGRIDTQRVVKCYGGSLKPPNVCIVLEYLPKGSLDQFIHGYVGAIPIGLVMRLAQEIAEGLDALHPTIVHRDLKPQNVLLDDIYQIKLADFGMSKMKEDTYLSQTKGVKGTPAYIAPEALKEESLDEKCDIYALGLIMWEMITKERPWQNCNFPVIVSRVAVNNERPPIPDSCPTELKRLIQRCWTTNPRERPTAREVVHKLIILRKGPTKSCPSDFYEFQNCFSCLQGKGTSQYTQNLMSETLNINISQFSIQSPQIGEQSENYTVVTQCLDISRQQ